MGGTSLSTTSAVGPIRRARADMSHARSVAPGLPAALRQAVQAHLNEPVGRSTVQGTTRKRRGKVEANVYIVLAAVERGRLRPDLRQDIENPLVHRRCGSHAAHRHRRCAGSPQVRVDRRSGGPERKNASIEGQCLVVRSRALPRSALLGGPIPANPCNGRHKASCEEQ